MQQFSLYHASEGLLYKTACQLVEKSYHSKFKIIILTPNIEVQESLNKLIWTYSRKQFLPHGSKLDPLHEKQPIYLTTELENPNKANMLIILAPFNIEEILNNADYMVPFQRVIIIYETIDNIGKIINAISNLTIASPNIECYKQHPIGTWSKQE